MTPAGVHGVKAGLPNLQAAHVQRMKAVNILLAVNTASRMRLRHPPAGAAEAAPGCRQYHHARSVLPDEVQHMVRCDGPNPGVSITCSEDAHLFARLHLAANVDLRRCIVDQSRMTASPARNACGSQQAPNLRGDLSALICVAIKLCHRGHAWCHAGVGAEYSRQLKNGRSKAATWKLTVHNVSNRQRFSAPGKPARRAAPGSNR